MDDWFVQVKGREGGGGRSSSAPFTNIQTYLLTYFVVCVDVQQWVIMTGGELLTLQVNTKVIYVQ